MPHTIFHISDLHFGDEDEEKIRALRSDIKTYKPNIFCLTGDIVNFPLPRYFHRASRFIDELETHAPGQVFLIPGNHDAFFGKLGIGLFKNYLQRDLQFAKFVKGGPDDPVVCIIGVNSTYPSPTHLWNTGRVTRPRLKDLKSKVKKLKHELGEPGYRSAYKIVLLHHHPLPTVSSQAEHMVYMQQAGRFLTEMVGHEIDMILHGHQHDPCDFSINYNIGGPGDLMVILSAGTTLKRIEEDSGISQTAHYNILTVSADKVEIQGMNYDTERKLFREWKASTKSFVTDPLAALTLEHVYKIGPGGLLTEEGEGYYQAKTGRLFSELRIPFGVDDDSPACEYNDCQLAVSRAGVRISKDRVSLLKNEDKQKLASVKLDPPINNFGEKLSWSYKWPGGWSRLLTEHVDRGIYYISRKTDKLRVRFVCQSPGLSIRNLEVTHKSPYSLLGQPGSSEMGFEIANPAVYYKVDYRIWVDRI